MQTINIMPKDESSATITFTYTGEDGTAVTPTSVTWTLTDLLGKIINSREDVSIVTPSTSNTFLLSGDDLDGSDGEGRIVTCNAVYTSETYGAGIPLREQGHFSISLFTEPRP